MIGEHLGRWTVVGPLGEGGMGTVWLARDEAGTEAAVKTLAVAGERQAVALRREIRALFRLRHPGVVRILDEGIEEGRPWYAMERIDGRPLALGAAHALAATLSVDDFDATAAVPQQGVWSGPRTAALRVLRRTCAILAWVHGEGVVHRDLKPGNVLVGRDGHPVIVDFGLAAHTAGARSREVLDVALAVGGTPAYVAPEQIRAEPVDARADLYAIGCMLYEEVTGSPPFGHGAARVVAGGHLFREPDPLPGDVAAPLADMIARLLHKDRAKRPASALAVVRALDLVLGDDEEPSGPAPQPTLYRPRFAGRERDAEALAEALQTATGPVVLVGPAGAGKTRLAVETATLLQQDRVAVWSAECRPDGEPLHALAPIAEQVLDRCRTQPDALARLLGEDGPFLARHLAPLRELVAPATAQLAADAERRRLLATLDGLVERLADGPIVWVVDDVQWADELSAAVLAAPRGSPRALLCCRAEEVPGWLPREPVHAIGRLDDDVIAGIVRDMLAADPPADLLESVVSRADGSPFFAAEILRMAVAERTVARDRDGDWHVVPGRTLPAADPGAVLEVVRRRLARLSPPARAAAAAAAVLGRRIEPTLARAMTGTSEAALLDALGELIAAVVLEEDAVGLQFAHDRVREAALPTDEAELRRLHGAAADVLASTDSAGNAAAIATHLERAGRTRDAADAHLRAAHALMASGATAEAEGHATSAARLGAGPVAVRVRATALLRLSRPGEALALVEHDPEHDGVLVRCEALVRIGDLAGAASLLAALCDQATDPVRRATVLERLASVRIRMGAFDEAERLLHAARACGVDDAAPTTAAAILDTLANLLMSVGRYADSLPIREQALAAWSACADRTREAACRMLLGHSLGAVGGDEEAARQIEEAARTFRAVGDRDGEAAALSNLSTLRRERGLRDDALALARAATGIFRATRNGVALPGALLNVAQACIALGADRSGLDAATEARSVALAGGNRLFGGLAAIVIGNALCEEAPSRAIASYDTARAELGEVGHAPGVERATTNRLVALALAGLADEALEGAAACADDDVLVLRASAVARLLRGETQLALDVAERLCRSDVPGSSCTASPALIHEALGDPGRALGLADEALDADATGRATRAVLLALRLRLAGTEPRLRAAIDALEPGALRGECLAWLAASEPASTEAAAEAERLLTPEAPLWSRVRWGVALALAARRRGAHEDARRHEDAARRLAPPGLRAFVDRYLGRDPAG